MKNKLLSICVPSYNMEQYLARNLESFLAADGLNKLELIVVNDGSTDNTLKIAKQYQIRHLETIVIIDKPNGHYGSCVNAALKVATGKYFRIVDADDWVDTDALNKMLKVLDEVNTDVVYTKYSNFYEKDGSLVVNENPAEMIWNNIVDLNNIRFNKYVHMHQISYRTNFLKEINYKQTEGVCYTDTEYIFKPLIQAKNIYCLDISLYQYYIGRDDQSMSLKVLMKNFNHLYKVLMSIVNYPIPKYTNNNYHFLNERYIHTLFGMLVDCLFASRCRNKEWNSKMRKLRDVLESKKIDLSHYLSFKIKGCHWLKWCLSDIPFAQYKLQCLFFLLDLRIVK